MRGDRVLRFTSVDVLNHLGGVAELVLAACPPPTANAVPLPSRGREGRSERGATMPQPLSQDSLPLEGRGTGAAGGWGSRLHKVRGSGRTAFLDAPDTASWTS